MSPDDGKVLKVVSIPKENWETEEIVLEELKVFKVIECYLCLPPPLLVCHTNLQDSLVTFDPGVLLVVVTMSSTSQTEITAKEEKQILSDFQRC